MVLFQSTITLFFFSNTSKSLFRKSERENEIKSTPYLFIFCYLTWYFLSYVLKSLKGLGVTGVVLACGNPLLWGPGGKMTS